MTRASLLRMMAFPEAATRDALRRSIEQVGIDRRLGARLFPIEYLHQSLSGAVIDSVAHRDAMLRAGDRISASSIAMTFDRVRGTGGRPGPLHWSALPRGKVDGFAALLGAVRAPLAAHGIVHALGHTPHLTLSYDAPASLPTIAIAPVTWTVDEIRLVVRHDRPFRYETLARWPLAPVRRAEQLSLPF